MVYSLLPNVNFSPGLSPLSVTVPAASFTVTVIEPEVVLIVSSVGVPPFVRRVVTVVSSPKVTAPFISVASSPFDAAIFKSFCAVKGCPLML